MLCVLRGPVFRATYTAHRHRDARAHVVAERTARRAGTVRCTSCSPAAKRGGNDRTARCDCDAESKSSVSSAWAMTPSASATSMAARPDRPPRDGRRPLPADLPCVPQRAWPGGSSEPDHRREVSTMWCSACWRTSAGAPGQPRCSCYRLRVLITGRGPDFEPRGARREARRRRAHVPRFGADRGA